MPRGRKPTFKKTSIVSIRFDTDDYERVREIAILETAVTGRITSVHSLIRDAVNFVYKDNERLRECFRRTRAHISKRWE